MPERLLSEVKVKKRCRKDFGNLEALVESIEDVGLLHPIVVDGENNLIAGERRLKAVKKLRWTKVPVNVVRNLHETYQLLKAERDENVCRKDFTPVEAVQVGKKLETEIEKPLAKERQKKGGSHGGKACGKLPQASGAKTRDRVGESVGMSGKTYEKAKKVVESGDQQAIDLMEERGKVEPAIRLLKEKKREEKRRKNAEKAKEARCPLKENIRFSTIVMDPPWDWGDEKDNDQLGRAKPDYATMSIDEIAALPVTNLADTDCHIYMWITNRSMPKGFQLLEEWGFRYICLLTWPKPTFGMGNYFRGQTEHVMFGVKGSLPLKRKNASTLLPTWKRGKRHSEKPVEFLDFVETVSYGPYLEMFSRNKRDNWNAWGADA